MKTLFWIFPHMELEKMHISKLLAKMCFFSMLFGTWAHAATISELDLEYSSGQEHVGKSVTVKKNVLHEEDVVVSKSKTRPCINDREIIINVKTEREFTNSRSRGDTAVTKIGGVKAGE